MDISKHPYWALIIICTGLAAIGWLVNSVVINYILTTYLWIHLNTALDLPGPFFIIVSISSLLLIPALLVNIISYLSKFQKPSLWLDITMIFMMAFQGFFITSAVFTAGYMQIHQALAFTVGFSVCIFAGAYRWKEFVLLYFDEEQTC